MKVRRGCLYLTSRDDRNPSRNQKTSHHVLGGRFPTPVPQLFVKCVSFANPPDQSRISKDMKVLFMVLNGTHLLELDPFSIFVILHPIAFIAFPHPHEIRQGT